MRLKVRGHFFDTLIHRLIFTARFIGMQDDKEGLFDTIQRNKSHYQKRAYQCIKCLVNLFSTCRIAYEIMLSNSDFKQRWCTSVSWLHEELERRPFAAGSQYTYNWSPPSQSNETSNGYYLERSQSARITLTKAVDLVPDEDGQSGSSRAAATEEVEEQDMSEGNDSPPPPTTFPVSSPTPGMTHQVPRSSPVPTTSSPMSPNSGIVDSKKTVVDRKVVISNIKIRREKE